MGALLVYVLVTLPCMAETFLRTKAPRRDVLVDMILRYDKGDSLGWVGDEVVERFDLARQRGLVIMEM